MRIIILISIAICSYFSVNGQCARPPLEFTLDTAKDYVEYNEISFRLMSCLVTSPTELSDKEIEEATAFCLMWLGGTPDYTIKIDTDVALFIDENPEYLYTYIFAMTLVERDFPTYGKFEKEAEALYLVSEYEKKLGVKKRCKSLKKVEKLYASGKLVKELKEVKKDKR